MLKKLGFLQDNNGDFSSKRLSGTLLIACSILVGWFIVIFNACVGSCDLQWAWKVLEGFLTTATVLLGVGVLENRFTGAKHD